MKILTIFLLFCLPVAVFSQADFEKKAVMKPIVQLFEAMQKADSTLLRAAFTKQVTMASIGLNKTGKTIITHESSLDDFAKAIATPHPEVYNEMIWDEKILIDGSFAQVWVNYAFYLGKNFSHCGVDAFHLLKGEDGTWKIFHLADTRKKKGCDVPEKISSMFK
ncbi:MAG: nuclear transport factor 2 family protein [Bacteroidetes bacterium]|nr:nuclear transport factor 2 family protein [Bacteroidota bacterium]